MVATSLMRIVSPCWKPLVEGENSSKHSNGRFSGLLWHKDFGTHANGDFSMAVIQANNLLEDHSQVESGPLGLLDDGPHGTFVGIYDGHGGPETARFVCDNLFKNIKSMSFFSVVWLNHYLILFSYILSSIFSSYTCCSFGNLY